jgi:hypothetical protein
MWELFLPHPVFLNIDHGCKFLLIFQFTIHDSLGTGNVIGVEVALTSVIVPVHMVAKREILVHIGKRIATVQLVMSRITGVSSLPDHAAQDSYF